MTVFYAYYVSDIWRLYVGRCNQPTDSESQMVVVVDSRALFGHALLHLLLTSIRSATVNYVWFHFNSSQSSQSGVCNWWWLLTVVDNALSTNAFKKNFLFLDAPASRAKGSNSCWCAIGFCHHSCHVHLIYTLMTTYANHNHSHAHLSPMSNPSVILPFISMSTYIVLINRACIIPLSSRVHLPMVHSNGSIITTSIIHL